MNVLDVPAEIAAYCKREATLPPKYMPDHRELKEREKWRGAKAFKTMLLSNPDQKFSNETAAELHKWFKELQRIDVRMGGTCLESPDPSQLNAHTRCKCTKCCPSESNAAPIRERLWFITTAQKFAETGGGKIEIAVPDALRAQFIDEQQIPQIEARAAPPPESFLSFVYNCEEIPNGAMKQFSQALSQWQAAIRDAGYQCESTCISSYDPCDLSIDCCCYTCRECFACGNRRLWIWKE